MGAAGAFLGYVEVFIEVDDPPRTGINTVLAPGALYRVDDDQAVIPLVKGSLDGTGRHAGGFITVHAEQRTVVHLYLGHCAPDVLVLLQPELSSIRLRLGIGRPVVIAVLSL